MQDESRLSRAACLVHPYRTLFIGCSKVNLPVRDCTYKNPAGCTQYSANITLQETARFNAQGWLHDHKVILPICHWVQTEMVACIQHDKLQCPSMTVLNTKVIMPLVMVHREENSRLRSLNVYHLERSSCVNPRAYSPGKFYPCSCLYVGPYLNVYVCPNIGLNVCPRVCQHVCPYVHMANYAGARVEPVWRFLLEQHPSEGVAGAGGGPENHLP